MNKAFSSLTRGVLYDRFAKVRANFYDKIDEKVHAATYEGEHELKYAEPEFTGKFMDICARYYEREGDERALNKGMAVVNSIEKNIRADGYLGMLGEGNELKMFSVWNQSFTLYGLTRMYDATDDEKIKTLCAVPPTGYTSPSPQRVIPTFLTRPTREVSISHAFTQYSAPTRSRVTKSILNL